MKPSADTSHRSGTAASITETLLLIPTMQIHTSIAAFRPWPKPRLHRLRAYRWATCMKATSLPHEAGDRTCRHDRRQRVRESAAVRSQRRLRLHHPRTLESDCESSSARASLMCSQPREADMYPVAQTYHVGPGSEHIATPRRGVSRWHFRGVATVVMKVAQCRPAQRRTLREEGLSTADGTSATWCASLQCPSRFFRRDRSSSRWSRRCPLAMVTSAQTNELETRS